MRLHTYLVAWALLLASALLARGALGPGPGAWIAGPYALASLLIVARAVIAYRRRLREFLRGERSGLWRSLERADGGRVGDARLLRWLLAPGLDDDAEVRAARATGALLVVMLVAWLMSTPAICIVLALRAA